MWVYFSDIYSYVYIVLDLQFITKAWYVLQNFTGVCNASSTVDLWYGDKVVICLFDDQESNCLEKGLLQMFQ